MLFHCWHGSNFVDSVSRNCPAGRNDTSAPMTLSLVRLVRHAFWTSGRGAADGPREDALLSSSLPLPNSAVPPNLPPTKIPFRRREMSYDTLAKLGNYPCHPVWAVVDQRQYRTQLII